MQLRIEEFRKQRHMTLKDLAQSVGVSIPTIYRWEKGKTPITLDDLRKVSRALNVPITTLWITPDDSIPV